MKKLLLVLSLLCTVNIGFGQSYNPLVTNVWSSPGVGVANQRVWIRVYNGSAIIKNSVGLTDANGNYRDSISTSVSLDSVISFTYDCNGGKIKGIAGALSAPNGWGYQDTIYQTCPITPLAGTANFVHAQSSTQSNTVNFTDNSIGSGIPSAKASYFCFFGDNDSSLVGGNFSHTYPGPGKYYVQYSYTEYDSIGDYYTQDWYRDTVEVLAGGAVNFCTAQYWVDTVNSGNNLVLIYNNSTPSIKDTNYTTSFHWDFGDGDTSNQAYPSHTYTTAGEYGVCLTISSISKIGGLCTSTFCDTMGVDSLGNLIYKNSGYSLQVYDPSTVGLAEAGVPDFEVYPNPVNDLITISGITGFEGMIEYSLTDVRGLTVKRGMLNTSRGILSIDVSCFESGVYLLNLTGNGNRLHSIRIVKN